MTERTKLVLEWERRWNEAEGGRVDVAELARLFGVSRQTAYVWIRRYEKGGHDVAALEEGSRRPHGHPKAVSEAMQDFLIDARKARPRWCQFAGSCRHFWVIFAGSCRHPICRVMPPPARGT